MWMDTVERQQVFAVSAAKWPKQVTAHNTIPMKRKA